MADLEQLVDTLGSPQAAMYFMVHTLGMPPLDVNEWFAVEYYGEDGVVAKSGSLPWDPHLHPRDEHGRFRNVLHGFITPEDLRTANEAEDVEVEALHTTSSTRAKLIRHHGFNTLASTNYGKWFGGGTYGSLEDRSGLHTQEELSGDAPGAVRIPMRVHLHHPIIVHGPSRNQIKIQHELALHSPKIRARVEELEADILGPENHDAAIATALDIGYHATPEKAERALKSAILDTAILEAGDDFRNRVYTAPEGDRVGGVVHVEPAITNTSEANVFHEELSYEGPPDMDRPWDSYTIEEKVNILLDDETDEGDEQIAFGVMSGLIDAGYDGILYETTNDEDPAWGSQVVAFSPDQIKITGEPQHGPIDIPPTLKSATSHFNLITLVDLLDLDDVTKARKPYDPKLHPRDPHTGRFISVHILAHLGDGPSWERVSRDFDEKVLVKFNKLLTDAGRHYGVRPRVKALRMYSPEDEEYARQQGVLAEYHEDNETMYIMPEMVMGLLAATVPEGKMPPGYTQEDRKNAVQLATEGIFAMTHELFHSFNAYDSDRYQESTEADRNLEEALTQEVAIRHIKDFMRELYPPRNDAERSWQDDFIAYLDSGTYTDERKQVIEVASAIKGSPLEQVINELKFSVEPDRRVEWIAQHTKMYEQDIADKLHVNHDVLFAGELGSSDGLVGLYERYQPPVPPDGIRIAGGGKADYWGSWEQAADDLLRLRAAGVTDVRATQGRDGRNPLTAEQQSYLVNLAARRLTRNPDLMIINEERNDKYVPDPTAPKEGEWVREPDPSGMFPNGIVVAWRQDHNELVKEALYNWKGAPTDAHIQMRNEAQGEPMPGSGSGKQKRMQAAALLWEVEHNGRPNPVPLYRGGDTSGEYPVPWSESEQVAAGFARLYHTDVHKLEPGEATGIRIADYIKTGLNDIEREWIVLPARHEAVKPPTKLKMKRLAPGEYEIEDPYGRGTWKVSRINYGYGDEWTAVTPDGVPLDPQPRLADVKTTILALPQ